MNKIREEMLRHSHPDGSTLTRRPHKQSLQEKKRKRRGEGERREERRGCRGVGVELVWIKIKVKVVDKQSTDKHGCDRCMTSVSSLLRSVSTKRVRIVSSFCRFLLTSGGPLL